jgi:probable DNA metabolism protein
VPPEGVVWQVGGGRAADLFGEEAARRPRAAPSFSVPRAFVDLARAAICHSDPERFALLYALLLRCASSRKAMEDRADPLVDRLERLAKEVRRDMHKMHAFVRFREVEAEGTRFVAWFEPDHHIVRAAAGFFVRRFANMRWSILTPELSIHWDGETLSEGPGATRADAPDGDPARGDVEDLLRLDLQSGAAEGRRDAEGDAEEILEKHAGDRVGRELIAGAQARGAGDDRWKGLANALEAERRIEPAATCAPPGRRCARSDGLHPLRPLQMRHADGVRRRAARRQDHVRRRAAGRPGGSCRPPVRRPGRAAVRPRARRGGRRPLARPTSPMRSSISSSSARQAAHPLQARRRRDRRLPLVDRAGARADPPADHRRARRHRGALAVRQDGDDLRVRGRAACSCRRRRMLGDGAPELPAPRPSRLFTWPLAIQPPMSR